MEQYLFGDRALAVEDVYHGDSALEEVPDLCGDCVLAVVDEGDHPEDHSLKPVDAESYHWIAHYEVP